MRKKARSKIPKKAPKGLQANIFTAVIQRERNGYASFCPELDIASQGENVEDARNNLQEAVELFLESAAPAEIKARMHSEIYITKMQVAFG